MPDYRQLGFRVPAIVVSNLAAPKVVHAGPFEHTSTLKMIESTFGLRSLTARDANTLDLSQVLSRQAAPPVPEGAIPTSGQVPGPPNGAAAFCSAASVQPTSPAPVAKGKKNTAAHVPPQSGYPTGNGMAELAHRHAKLARER